jgi:hypothetical protein
LSQQAPSHSQSGQSLQQSFEQHSPFFAAAVVDTCVALVRAAAASSQQVPSVQQGAPSTQQGAPSAQHSASFSQHSAPLALHSAPFLQHEAVAESLAVVEEFVTPAATRPAAIATPPNSFISIRLLSFYL